LQATNFPTAVISVCKECSVNSEYLYEGYKDGAISGGNLSSVFPRRALFKALKRKVVNTSG
jgi:hypothetical protein